MELSSFSPAINVEVSTASQAMPAGTIAPSPPNLTVVPPAPRRAALVHDYLLTPRGAERTFEAMAAGWRGSQVFTSLYDAEAMADRFEGHEITTSNLQRIRARQGMFRMLLPLFPSAVERLPVSGQGLVISSSSAFAHGVRPSAGATHVCYCHSPFRYAWHERALAVREAPRAARFALRETLDRIRRWDVAASSRVTHYIANSEITQQRIADFYGRESTVIHPPVKIDRFGAPKEPEDYFLYVGEVTGHKRVEVAVEAARLAGKKLKIVGDGPDRARIEALHAEHTEFVGRVSDEQLNEIFARAQALIVPNVEEFGIAAVEAQAAGRPVVATARGGTRETVVDGITGVLVPNGTVEEFAEVLSQTDFTRFNGPEIATYATRFSAERFQLEFEAFVQRSVSADICDSWY